ncbi:YlbF family regulator [Anaerosporobacter sp.]|uniref:YlbF family regulator n=1 Tax=Anaerosporobacter sp. TaxID=1872529 RepID=UPI00286EE0C7|nr:YlbF family regulator [Anaerosporobacter sp.]
MKDIEYQMKNLVDSIKKSNEYNQYRRLYEELERESEVLTRLNEFRKMSFRIQLAQEENSLELCRVLREEYSDVLMLPRVQEFLIAEQRINTVLRKVNHYMWDNIDLKIDFM